MKRMIFLMGVLFSFHQSFCQQAVFEWAKQLDRRQGTEEVYLMGVDDDKNVYIAGGFTHNIDVDPGPGEFNLTGSPLDQIFVVKLDPAGNFIWGKKIGGTRFTKATHMHVDHSGNMYITGMFSGTTDFDPGPATFEYTATFTPGPENYDMFSVKLDRDGNFKWAHAAGNLDVDMGVSVVADRAGNVYTTGNITSEVDFDPGPGQTILGSNGTVNTFITKYNSQGNFIWAKHFTSTFYNCYAFCIGLDQADNIYVSGKFNGIIDFDPGPSVYTMNSPQNGNPNYITKLTKDGNFIWAKNQGGSWFVVSDDQHIFSFYGSAGFQGSLEKYDRDGNVVWSKLMGGRPSTWPAGNGPIAIDPANNIYLTGEFNYTADFDPSPSVYNMTAVGGGFNFDAFITRFDYNGNFIWAKQMGNFSEEHPTSIAVDTAGGIYSTGIYINRVDFDPGPGVFEMEAYTGGGMYIQKLQRCQDATYHSMNINICTAFTLNGRTYTESGTYRQSLVNAVGCDSIIVLKLVVDNIATNVITTACDSYTWNGNIITASGQYTHTYTSVNGCDSVVNLNLTINKSVNSTINRKICEGTNYEGYQSTGVYTDHFIAANGCDSTRVLNLEVTPIIRSAITATICKGEMYEGYSSTGTYTDKFLSSTGCDSIRVLNLLVNPAYNFSVTKTICIGENYLGHTRSGIYTDHFQTTSGCDSVQVAQLTVLEKPKPVLGRDTAICMQDSLVLRPGGGLSSFIWQDGSVNDYFVVRSPGIYSVKATNNCGHTTSSITIEAGPCSVFFPTAFTPDGNGKNDRFGILNPRLISDYHLVIYDRSGMVVFETRNPLMSWDGNYRGYPLNSGVFVWKCSFKEENKLKNYKGTITMLR